MKIEFFKNFTCSIATLFFLLGNLYFITALPAQTPQEIKDTKSLPGKEYQRDYQRQENLKFLGARDYWERDNDLNSALREFEEYIELYKDGIHITEAYLYLAKLYKIKKEYKKAVTILSTLHNLFPDKREGAEGKIESCRLMSIMGKGKEAKLCFRFVEKNYKKFADIHRQAQMELYILDEKFLEIEKPKEPMQPKEPEIKIPELKGPQTK